MARAIACLPGPQRPLGLRDARDVQIREYLAVVVEHPQALVAAVGGGAGDLIVADGGYGGAVDEDDEVEGFSGSDGGAGEKLIVEVDGDFGGVGE